MNPETSEDSLIEATALETFKALGWAVNTAWHKETFSESHDDRSDSLLGRINKSEVLLLRDLLQALRSINPGLPKLAYHQAADAISNIMPDKLAETNQRVHQMCVDGVLVKYENDAGKVQQKRLKLFDFDNPSNNIFRAVRQLEIVGEISNRRPDLVGFVNGIPLVLFELKAHHAYLDMAYDTGLKRYKTDIPEVLQYNAFIILSNGEDSRIGTVTAPYQHFRRWKHVEEDDTAENSLERVLRGTCDKARLLDLLQNFILFDQSSNAVNKLMTGDQQYLAVNKIVDRASSLLKVPQKLGLVHQPSGTGITLSMVFLCQKITRNLGGKFTFLIVTDRKELESQRIQIFHNVGALEEVNCAESQAQLCELLKQNHRYIFTLLQKFPAVTRFQEEQSRITERDNIIVIVDEALRGKQGSYMNNMYNGIPNAHYLGFTHAPVTERNEAAEHMFGESVSMGSFSDYVDDI